jgi:hypothetical protein
MRQVFDARLGQLALGDVARDAEHADGRAAGVGDGPLVDKNCTSRPSGRVTCSSMVRGRPPSPTGPAA